MNPNQQLPNLLFGNNQTFIPFSLSVSEPSIKDLSFLDVKKAEETILQFLDGKIGYGGYLEKRNVYQRSALFGSERNIHLGVDFFGAVDTPIFCPLSGEVHSFAFNNNGADYGATIILKHEKFYTIYGHLALKDIANIKVGQRILTGEPLAHFGNIAENGGWPAHLHFQVINNIGDAKGDYQGVCVAEDVEKLKVNCPDPFSIKW